MSRDGRPGSLVERLRYRFDLALASGTRVIVIWLGVFSAAVVLLAAAVLWVARIEINGKETPFLEGVWVSLVRTLDPGTGGADEGAAFRGVSIFVTFAGIFVVTVLIGLVTNGINTRLEELRKGRSIVLERGHSLILGWSPKIFTIADELITAGDSRHRVTIVILAPQDKAMMEDELRARLPASRHKHVRLVCRSGDPSRPDDLALVDPRSARSAVILATGLPDSDGQVTKTVLAVQTFNEGPTRLPIVAEFHNQLTAAAVTEISDGQVEIVVSSDLVARMTAQVLRHGGLSLVYQDLIDFGGDEIYVTARPEVVGSAFGAAQLQYDQASVIGLCRASGTIELAPPPDSVIAPDDCLIAIAADEAAIVWSGAPTEPALPGHPAWASRNNDAEVILVVGWNDLGPAILSELDTDAPPGSTVDILSDPALASVGDFSRHLDGSSRRLSRLAVSLHSEPTTRRDSLQRLLTQRRYTHVLVLAYTGTGVSEAEADARTLMTLVQLHRIVNRAEGGGAGFTVVAQLLDAQNVALARFSTSDDFMVSEKLTSLVLAQISQDPIRGSIFRELLAPGGAELELRPAGDYLPIGVDMMFGDVVLAGQARGHVVIGYRRSPDGEPSSPSLELNPSKKATVSFQETDRLIVITPARARQPSDSELVIASPGQAL